MGSKDFLTLAATILWMGYKTVLHDKLIKERLFRFMAEHPWFTVELFVWYKPKTFVTQYAWMFGDYRPRI